MTPPTDLNRRQFLSASASTLAIVSATGHVTPVVVPDPLPTLLKVSHVVAPGGISTVIARVFDRPDLCQLCPREQCDHRGGFCMVTVDRYVPLAECGLYKFGTGGAR